MLRGRGDQGGIDSNRSRLPPPLQRADLSPANQRQEMESTRSVAVLLSTKQTAIFTAIMSPELRKSGLGSSVVRIEKLLQLKPRSVANEYSRVWLKPEQGSAPHVVVRMSGWSLGWGLSGHLMASSGIPSGLACSLGRQTWVCLQRGAELSTLSASRPHPCGL